MLSKYKTAALTAEENYKVKEIYDRFIFVENLNEEEKQDLIYAYENGGYANPLGPLFTRRGDVYQDD